MFTDDYKAQLSLLNSQTLSLEAMLSRKETQGPEWHDLRAKVAIVRDCIRRVSDIHADAAGKLSTRDVDRLEYETAIMNRRFDELLTLLEGRVHTLTPGVEELGPLN